MLKKYPSYFYLSYTGALPFIATALLIGVGQKNLSFFGSIVDAMLLYALIIASFMAGTHWGQYMAAQSILPRYLLATSNFSAIALWFAYWYLPNAWLIWMLIATFLGLLCVDYKITAYDPSLKNYFKMRLSVTLVVCLCLFYIRINL